jgi:hypothetical protein
MDKPQGDQQIPSNIPLEKHFLNQMKGRFFYLFGCLFLVIILPFLMVLSIFGLNTQKLTESTPLSYPELFIYGVVLIMGITLFVVTPAFFAHQYFRMKKLIYEYCPNIANLKLTIDPKQYYFQHPVPFGGMSTYAYSTYTGVAQGLYRGKEVKVFHSYDNSRTYRLIAGGLYINRLSSAITAFYLKRVSKLPSLMIFRTEYLKKSYSQGSIKKRVFEISSNFSVVVYRDDFTLEQKDQMLDQIKEELGESYLQAFEHLPGNNSFLVMPEFLILFHEEMLGRYEDLKLFLDGVTSVEGGGE